MMPGFGRKLAVDPRDDAHPIRSLFVQLPQRLRTHRYWYDTDWWGDQHETSQCVGYSWMHWLMNGPVTKPYTISRIGPAEIYHRAQRVDEWEGEDYDGTSVRAGAKVLKELGYITSYYWAQSTDDIIDAVLNLGPVVVGTDWYEGMMNTDKHHLLRPMGQVVGGHAYLINGVSLPARRFRIKNSWGKSWGYAGRGYIDIGDFIKLFKAGGEACLAVETP